MKPLERLPVLVVVKLCTDDDKIVQYWNEIDNQLELEIDVLDDLCSEAAEIHGKNPWLTYGEPLHRLREFGLPIKEIDLLDEQALSSEQMRVVVAAILGGRPDDYPHPSIDFPAFRLAVDAALRGTPSTWCPFNKTAKPWINSSQLSTKYNSDNSESGAGCLVA